MSTTILYNGFGIQGYQHVHTKVPSGAIYFRVRQDVFNLRCPVCGSYNVKCRGKLMRRFCTVPIGSEGGMRFAFPPYAKKYTLSLKNNYHIKIGRCQITCCCNMQVIIIGNDFNNHSIWIN